MPEQIIKIEYLPADDLPLITFALFAYNQEKYIRYAIDGAFAQTYARLEIILSDDCSTDRTFDIMQEMAEAYKGPHQIRLNKNTKNLGIGEHVNTVVGLANGEIIVGAAGDDISLPERTTALAEIFIKNPNVYSVYSNMIEINDNGDELGLWVPESWEPVPPNQKSTPSASIFVFGCTHAYRKKLFEFFGGLHPDVIHEDSAIPFRSSLLGEINYLSKPLVLYRRHDSNVWLEVKKGTDLKSYVENRRRFLKDKIGLSLTRLSDLRICESRLGVEYSGLIKKEMSRLQMCQTEYQISSQNTVVRKIQSLTRIFGKGISTKEIIRIVLDEFFPSALICFRRLTRKSIR